jgi:hypothetical protein
MIPIVTFIQLNRTQKIFRYYYLSQELTIGMYISACLPLQNLTIPANGTISSIQCLHLPSSETMFFIFAII